MPSETSGDNLGAYVTESFSSLAASASSNPLGARASSGVKPPVRVFRVGDSVIVDINAIPSVIAAVKPAMEAGAEAGAAVIKDAIVEVFKSQGGPRKWAPNTAWTKRRKGAGKPPMFDTGALIGSLEVRRVSPVASVVQGGVGRSAQRHIGFFDDLHPYATTENYKLSGSAGGGPGRRMTFGEVAWVNELGIQLVDSVSRKGKVRERFIPARPWVSKAADLRGRRAVNAAIETTWAIIASRAIDPAIIRRGVRSISQSTIRGVS